MMEWLSQNNYQAVWNLATLVLLLALLGRLRAIIRCLESIKTATEDGDSKLSDGIVKYLERIMMATESSDRAVDRLKSIQESVESIEGRLSEGDDRPAQLPST